MKTEEYIQRVCSKIKGYNPDGGNDPLPNFLLFDEEFNGCLQVNAIVQDSIEPLLMLEKLVSDLEKEKGDFTEDKQKLRFFKRYYFNNYAVSLKANMDHNELFNILEFIPTKQVRYNQDLINKVLDIDEIKFINENPNRIFELNEKYNVSFGESLFYMNFHVLNLRTKKSSFFSSEMIPDKNGNFEFGQVKLDNTNYHLFEESLKSYEECKEQFDEFKKDGGRDLMKGLLNLLKDMKNGD